MNTRLILQIFVAMTLAILTGWYCGTTTELFGVPVYQLLELGGKLFLNALKLVVIPLVASSIIIGAARLGGESMGNMGAKTFGYFFLTSTLAVFVGALLVWVIQPGAMHALPFNSTLVTLQGSPFDQISKIVMRVIPDNILKSASESQILGIIPFCLLFGYFTSKIESHAAHALLGFWKGVFEVTMLMTKFIMRALPFGVFALIGNVVATAKPELFRSLASFAATALAALAIYAFVVLPLLLKSKGISVLKFYKALSPALLTAFTTSSSAATLPVTLECIEKEAKISNKVSSFVLPLGTSINLPGSALYQCVGVFFIVQVYGIDLSLTSAALIMLLSLVTTFGMAGIPSASLVSILLILHTFNIPEEGIGLLAAFDRFLDMCRTPVNVLGASCSTALVAKSEGEAL